MLATNSIRGGFNQGVLKRIKESGDIFMAWSDRPWILDGAAVRVSIIGFDNGNQLQKTLDSVIVPSINPDLTSHIDTTTAIKLKENFNLSFQGINKVGPFDMEESLARHMLNVEANPNGRSNSDVLKPIRNASDITGNIRNMWIVDFGTNMPVEQAAEYLLPFEYVQKYVKPERDKVNRKTRRERWWLFGETTPAMRRSLASLSRYIVTPGISKHRMFAWLDSSIIPDHALIVIARDDDYFFGVLHSRLHELWSLRMGTSLEDRPRYTPTTTFETFPFPWPPGEEPQADPDLTGGRGAHLSGLVADIARWARALVDWRDEWLNPPPPAKGTLDVAYDRLIKVRTLTNLYNGLVYFRETRQDLRGFGKPLRSEPFDRAAFDKETRKSVSAAEIQELDDIHRALDAAVLRAYGWPEDLSDEAILERLLELNKLRATERSSANAGE